MTLVGYGESPGRLDFMGGVADYSGSLVLEMPIRGKTRVEVTYLPQPLVYLESVGFDKYHFNLKPLRDLLFTFHAQPAPPPTPPAPHPNPPSSQPSGRTSTRSACPAGAATSSAASSSSPCASGGCRAQPLEPVPSPSSPSSSSAPSVGLRFLINSEVNASMGVSSSAAIEVATLRALASLAQHTALALGAPSDSLSFHPTEIAHLGQLAENRIVGAPCGLMDQLSVAYGQPLHLLPILCRPDVLYPNIPLPDGVVVVGWPSGIKHSVGESPYSVARTGAFMGKRMMEDLVGVKVRFTAEFSPSTLLAPPAPLALQHQRPHHHQPHDERKPYASRLSLLPLSMLGADFIRRYGGVDDALSLIKPDLHYPVRDAFHFPIAENFRCQLVASLLSSLQSVLGGWGCGVRSAVGAAPNRGAAVPEPPGVLGDGAGVCGDGRHHLGAAGDEGGGVYGGRISGGGSGGTVVVLCEHKAVEAVRRQLKSFPQLRSAGPHHGLSSMQTSREAEQRKGQGRDRCEALQYSSGWWD